MTVGNINSDSELPESFYTDIYELLQQYPDGISEYDLLQLLKEQGYFAFVTTSPASPLALFRMHFLLFHALYQLQLRGFERCQEIVHITPLNICLRSYHAGETAITEQDPLREYYLDLDNLADTGETEVNELLEAFWQEFACHSGRAGALAELGLSDPVDEHTIKQAYRRLAMEHHPDRGGDRLKLQAINSAYATLRRRN